MLYWGISCLPSLRTFLKYYLAHNVLCQLSIKTETRAYRKSDFKRIHGVMWQLSYSYGKLPSNDKHGGIQENQPAVCRWLTNQFCTVPRCKGTLTVCCGPTNKQSEQKSVKTGCHTNNMGWYGFLDIVEYYTLTCGSEIVLWNYENNFEVEVRHCGSE